MFSTINIYVYIHVNIWYWVWSIYCTTNIATWVHGHRRGSHGDWGPVISDQWPWWRWQMSRWYDFLLDMPKKKNVISLYSLLMSVGWLKTTCWRQTPRSPTPKVFRVLGLSFFGFLGVRLCKVEKMLTFGMDLSMSRDMRDPMRFAAMFYLMVVYCKITAPLNQATFVFALWAGKNHLARFVRVQSSFPEILNIARDILVVLCSDILVFFFPHSQPGQHMKITNDDLTTTAIIIIDCP